MSIHLSVSNNKNTGCQKILRTLLKAGIDCRTIQTKSLVNKKIEKGCLVTIGDDDTSRQNVKNLWDLVKDDYGCAHLKIDGIYSGCVYNYINTENCPACNQ